MTNNNPAHAVVYTNGYSDNNVVFVGSLHDCNAWLTDNTVSVASGSNTWNCVPDPDSPNGYESNGDGYPDYYSVQPLND